MNTRETAKTIANNIANALRRWGLRDRLYRSTKPRTWQSVIEIPVGVYFRAVGRDESPGWRRDYAGRLYEYQRGAAPVLQVSNSAVQRKWGSVAGFAEVLS
ncbi:hypothetical protein ACFRAQ_36090 [Nocardia sp. NPDC056611]|uniref:hypothetical protein n=1 Tax=Nocardia sp. NPDC056611 TaxID=3345877 RepID=UPI00366BDB91